ncbi:hypothetical protein CONPUDRAFT_159512 [Coniophora puteana RWD-64-598 SS2]|uniref:Uncharacterized protein n=1 Tax=Coniophora puteana (strain RWD-64-598) TaxID=741705 RepID=A0A5M3M7G9_CONPW|nr:uncharacterized protein CONPUDRAFT_159512 [Coniophora puteana RWD-64-598 SS2]EIW74730.1 hypothetical protein CONPUDRAFT_159512 [Coniophora puteana RWD-64-598 SS2]
MPSLHEPPVWARSTVILLTKSRTVPAPGNDYELVELVLAEPKYLFKEQRTIRLDGQGVQRLVDLVAVRLYLAIRAWERRRALPEAFLPPWKEEVHLAGKLLATLRNLDLPYIYPVIFDRALDLRWDPTVHVLDETTRLVSEVWYAEWVRRNGDEEMKDRWWMGLHEGSAKLWRQTVACKPQDIIDLERPEETYPRAGGAFFPPSAWNPPPESDDDYVPSDHRESKESTISNDVSKAFTEISSGLNTIGVALQNMSKALGDCGFGQPL